LKETFALSASGQRRGHYQNERGGVIGYALTPGYETYKGLGWYGVLVQKRPAEAADPVPEHPALKAV
jgi:hypothetical protein